MVKKAASVRLTGGAGFQYEDRVGAWFLLQMLTARQPLGSEYGVVSSVHFQVRESGWLLDDLLVILSQGQTEHSIPISIKSYRYVKASGFPDEFTSLIWQHWLGGHSNPFKKQHDLMGLVTGRLANSVKDAWDDLLDQASTVESSRLAQRLSSSGQSNELQRVLFSSLHCPTELQCPTGTNDEDTVELLKHIRLLNLDLQESISVDHANALTICQSVLQSGDSSEAIVLWRILVEFAAELRASGGSADLTTIIRRLNIQFKLKDYPNHEHNWSQLSHVSNAAMALISGEINGIVLPRAKVVEQILNKAEQGRIIVIIGESGCGKSAIAKELITTKRSSFKNIWFTSKILDQSDIISLERQLGLQNPLINTMNAVVTPRAYLVLDAMESFTDQAIEMAAFLLRQLRLQNEDSPWRVLITAQPDGWEVILPYLVHLKLSKQLIIQHVVQAPELGEIDFLMSKIPNLQLPSLSRDVRPILRNLKTLAYVVSSAMSYPNVNTCGWTGVCDVIQWIWNSWISDNQDKYVRGETLKLLATLEAETLFSGVSLRQLTESGRSMLPGLERSGVVHVSEEHVYFMHELAGDWSLLRVIIGEQEDLTFLRSKVLLPRWHRAIRLYAQSLLEKGEEGLADWRRIISSTNDKCPQDVTLRDLFLESAVLAVNSVQLLEQIWPDLSRGNAHLLARLLKKFLHTATMPDPRIIEASESKQNIGALAAIMRVPYWPYWGSVLCFLHKHREELPISIQEVVAKVCELWLKSTKPEFESAKAWPWRHEAAETALRVAREVQAVKAEGRYFSDNKEQKAYEAVLNAASDLPEEVVQIALELCGRKNVAFEVQARADQALERRRKERDEYLKSHPEKMEELKKRTASFSIPDRMDWLLRQPWPDGPMRRIDDTFRKVCLSTQAINPLILINPEIAQEIILAVCIEEPKPNSPFGYREMIMDYLGTEMIPDMYPPMFFRGPFLNFLRYQPLQGLETIIHLVNFATDRWMDSQQQWAQANGRIIRPERLHVAMSVLDHTAQWNGNQYLYGWFRNHLISANLVVSALMACEKWLYDLIDTNQDISPWISQILHKSESVAFAGLLAEVGKKKHELFAGPLMPLLGIWQIYEWDNNLLINSDVWQIEMMSWTSWGERIWNIVRDWHIIPHRKTSLQEIAVYLLLTNKNVQRFFQSMREQWTEQLKNNPNNRTLELLIARFDPINYKASKAEDGKVGLEWPEQLREETDAKLHKSQVCLEVLGFPMTCRRILDDEQVLTNGELSNFWNKVLWIANIDINQDKDLSTRQVANAIYGGIAVLIAKHKNWLEEDKERTKWCIDKLISILNSPPPRDPFEIPQSVMTIRWDCFVAEAAVAILADSQSNEFARQLVATCVTSYYYKTTSVTMRAAYHLRQKLGDDFLRMQNLAILWATLRNLRYRGEVLKADLNQLSIWYDRLIKAFIRKAIPAKTLPWGRIESFACHSLERMENRYRKSWWESTATELDEEPKAKPSNNTEEKATPSVPTVRRRHSIRYPGLDIHVLQSAFSWLPSLSEAQDDSERKAWINNWHELLSVTFRMVGSQEGEEDEELSGMPYDYDHWVFKNIAQLIPQMNPKESPERFWQPILDLDSSAHYWIEDFLHDWTIYGPDAAKNLDEFVMNWRSMIKHCLNSPKWNARNNSTFHLDTMYIALMGIDLGSERVGREDFAEPLRSMLDLFKRWADDWLRQWNVLIHFARFLTKPSARDIICLAVQWIRVAVDNFTEYDWHGFHHEELESLLADILRICWMQHRQTIRCNPDLQEAFLGLLTILTSRLCPSAMELHDEVLRSLAK